MLLEGVYVVHFRRLGNPVNEVPSTYKLPVADAAAINASKTERSDCFVALAITPPSVKNTVATSRYLRRSVIVGSSPIIVRRW